MDFELNEDQQAILESVERLLAQNAGPDRAVALNRDDDYDYALHEALEAAGFHSIAREFTAGDGVAGLEAALTVEAIARAGGVAASAAQIMVAPAISENTIEGPIALCSRSDLEKAVPVRYAAHAKHLLMLDGDNAFVIPVAANDMEAVRTSFGYPMGKASSTSQLADQGVALGPDSAHKMRNWWRLSLAVEAVGTMDAALGNTVEYLKQRRQFGRAIGSFQAVQHRLSLCAIHLEASRWLSREAAYQSAPDEAVAAAAAFALEAADQLFTETHQLSGAIGFTHEFNLHVWSMRLLALRQELDGVGGARRALVEARWGKTG